MGNSKIYQGSYNDLIFSMKNETKKKIIMKNFTDFKIEYSEKLCIDFKNCKVSTSSIDEKKYELIIGDIEIN